jgi:hypothetical protein
MSFGNGSVRPVPKTVPKTSVELMLGSGLKYIHATKRGFQGMEGDLEKSKKIITDSYKTQEQDQELLAENRQNAFDEWSALKENREAALRYLALLTPPRLEKKVVEDDEVPFYSPHCNLPERDLNYVMTVGELLKKVDRNLFTDWLKWCNSTVETPPAEVSLRKSISTVQKEENVPCLVSFFFGSSMWDYFEPRCCDIHSTANSQVCICICSISIIFAIPYI